MTVTRQNNDAHVTKASFWGPERRVEVQRAHNNNLGFSIVGGKVLNRNIIINSDECAEL